MRPHLIHSNLKYVDWSFFATAHGKGPVDGVGGTVKRAVWRRILQKQVVVNTAEDFAKVAKEACPNIAIIYVTKEAINQVRVEFEHLWSGNEPRNIPNIRQSHFFRKMSSSSTELEKSALTPYFEEVRESTTFDSVHIFRSDVIEHSVDINVSLDEYFAVDYVNKFYIGRTVEKRENGHWKIKFLHETTIDGIPIFNWPKLDDCEVVHESSVFFGPITLEGTVQDFKIPVYKEVLATFRK